VNNLGIVLLKEQRDSMNIHPHDGLETFVDGESINNPLNQIVQEDDPFVDGFGLPCRMKRESPRLHPCGASHFKNNIICKNCVE
jgi:hypothetical protein